MVRIRKRTNACPPDGPFTDDRRVRPPTDDRRDGAFGSERAFASERAVSTVVGYSIGLGVVTLLITGLLVGVGGFIQDQREATTRTELRVIGQQLAADVRVTDTLVRTAGGSPGAVSYRQDLPETTAGGGYTVAVNQSGCECLVLLSEDPDVRVRVPVTANASLAERRFTGGDVVLEYTGTALEVRAADG